MGTSKSQHCLLLPTNPIINSMCTINTFNANVGHMNTGRMISPANQGFMPAVQSPIRSPSRESKVSTVTGIVVDPHWSGRTFNIPDCPSKNTVGSLKDWYTRNICPTAQQSQLRIVRQDSGNVIEDECPFWQLAEGDGVFTVTVVHVKPEPLRVVTSNNSSITLYVQHDTSGISTSVELPLKSTLLQLKIKAFEQLCLGDAAAALDPQIGFTFQGVALDNEATLHSAHLAHGDHIYIGERRSPPVSRRVSRTPSPTGEEVNYQSIAGIWAGTNADSPYDSGSNSAYDSGSNSGDDEVREIMCHECPPLCLPSSLLDDEEPTYASQRPRRQRRNSDSKADRKQQSEIDRMKLSYRTKMCRSGFGACKFGQQCWFAHIQEELRKPSDPLPPQCPGVSKLEKYARRQD